MLSTCVILRLHCCRPLQNIQAVLTWNCTQPLHYTVKIFEQFKQPLPVHVPKKHKPIIEKLSTKLNSLAPEINVAKLDHPDGEWLPTKDLKNTGAILIVVDIPEFTERTSYEVNGVLVYQKQKIQQTQFPKLSLEVWDLTNDSLLVKKVDLMQGRSESFLATLAVHEETKLFVNLPDAHGRTLDSILEIDCLFRRMGVVSSGQWYAAEDASKGFEGLVMQVAHDDRIENKKYFNVFSKSTTQMLTLLHYLYKNIPGVAVLPTSSEEAFLVHSNDASKGSSEIFLRNDVRQLGLAMEEEVKLTKEYCEELMEKENVVDKIQIENERKVERYKSFRLKLAKLENDTDLLYKKLKCCYTNENSSVMENMMMDMGV